MSARQASTRSRSAWIVLGVGVFAYIVAITQRTSFGVASLDAAHRLHTDATTLSVIGVAQLAVYAALQVPVGVLADRVPARVILAVGALIMLLGQLLVAFGDQFGEVLVGRLVVGAGDACTFISVIRLLPDWFEPRLLPHLSQWVGILGNVGQLLSAIPFAALLQLAGWRSAFGMAAGLAALSAVLVIAIVRAGPRSGAEHVVASTGTVRGLRDALSRPGTRLGFWMHMFAGTAPNTFGAMWGYPLLTEGFGYAPALASGLLIVMVVGSVLAGPMLGALAARYPLRRTALAFTVVAVTLVWTIAVMAAPTPTPIVGVVGMFLLVGAGGPTSLLGLDVARSFNPTHTLGSASGIVNVGGFVGAFVAMFGIGVGLDLAGAARGLHGTAVYDLTGFRFAMLALAAIPALALIGILIERRATRRRMREETGIEVRPLGVALMARRRRTPRG